MSSGFLRRGLSLAAGTVIAGTLLLARPARLHAWGEYGHKLVGRTAAAALPAEMPAFFRQAGPQLAYLNPEPDRWRERAERELDRALDGATGPDHFIDLDLIPADRQASALMAPTRFAYADTLRALHLDPPIVGMLPFRIVELTQVLRSDFRRWRTAPDSATRTWIEQRILDDAGVLGHYVADASNPLHASRYYNGWSGENPNGYTTDSTLHARFETRFVQARLVDANVTPLVAATPHVVTDLRAGVIAYVRASNGQLTRLYDLEKVASFTPENASPDHQRFVAERLAAGATMLRDLWWTAWVTSGAPVTKER